MKRKDGRELVTEHPVTAEDRIDIIPGIDVPRPGVLACRATREPVDETWMEPDEGALEDDFDLGEWHA